MRIAITTDAWFPQVNGVVRTLAATVNELTRRGYEVELITPQQFRTMAMPGYASIRLALAPRFTARRLLHAFCPDLVHIATEGPIGWSARGWCKAHGVPFTTAFHTRFPDYAAVRTGLSPERFWPLLRRFHGQSRTVLVATESLREELAARGFARTLPWGRGIDQGLFRPDGALHPSLAALPRPLLLNVGRVAPEKNLEAFLALSTPGSKVVVGDGPALDALRGRFPEAHFMGAMAGEELASAYRAADCFVFPSLTDTFGLVLIEALACGVPVAGFPVPGPLDVIGRNGRGWQNDFPAQIGALDGDLGVAVARALRADRVAAALYGRQFSWDRATSQFLAAIESARQAAPEPVA